MADLYIAGAGGTLEIGGEYDPGITEEIDRKIRNLPIVVETCRKKAEETLGLIGSPNFEVVVSQGKDQSRPRAYICPANNRGIHEELSQGVLLKAALGMSGR